jgi:hypothetical protein
MKAETINIRRSMPKGESRTRRYNRVRNSESTKTMAAKRLKRLKKGFLTKEQLRHGLAFRFSRASVFAKVSVSVCLRRDY